MSSRQQGDHTVSTIVEIGLVNTRGVTNAPKVQPGFVSHMEGVGDVLTLVVTKELGTSFFVLHMVEVNVALPKDVKNLLWGDPTCVLAMEVVNAVVWIIAQNPRKAQRTSV